MLKKQKILIFLLGILLVIVLYLILTSESVKKTDQPEQGQPAQQEKAAVLEENYQKMAKPIFIGFEELLSKDNFTVDKIIELKNKLLDLKVPAKFKELHIQLVLAMAKMENYLNQKKQEEKTDSLLMINQLKANYSWLNN